MLAGIVRVVERHDRCIDLAKLLIVGRRAGDDGLGRRPQVGVGSDEAIRMLGPGLTFRLPELLARTVGGEVVEHAVREARDGRHILLVLHGRNILDVELIDLGR